MQFLFALLMFVASLFLILLVLVQRGRGGGLSGAFGGMGGQSAFGAKAGDTFTKITIISASVWILLCMLATGLMGGGGEEDSILTRGGNGAATAPADGSTPEGGANPSDLDTPPGAPADPTADPNLDLNAAAGGDSDAGAADSTDTADGDSAESATTVPAEPTTDADVTEP